MSVQVFPGADVSAVIISDINFSAGTTSNNLSAVTFSNSNGVSFGLNGSVITASAAVGGGGITNIKVSAGTLSALRSDITFNNSNGVSFGLETNGIITGTVATNYQSSGAYLTTAMLSNAVTLSNAKISAGTLSALRSDLTFSNSNGVSFGLETNGVITGTVATNYQSAGAYLTTAALSQDSSKYAFTGFTTTTIAGDVVAGTHNTDGLKLAVPAFLTAAAGGGITNINVSAGTTSNNLSALTFDNGNGVSFGLDASTITATVRTDYQSAGAYLTTAALSQDSSKYAGTNGAITGGSITVNTSGVSVNLPAYLTTAMLSNAATISNVNISAGTTSRNLSALTFADSNGVSFGLSGSVITATVQTNYQPSGAYLTTAMQSNAATISNINVSAGTTSNNLSAVTFSNSNGVSFGLSGSVVTGTVKTDYQSAGAYLTTAMQSNAATISNVNVSAGTTSNNLSAFVFSNSNGVSFGLNGSTVTGTVATNYQSQGAYLTTAALSQDSSKYAFTGFTTTTVAGAVVAGTHNTDGLKLAVPGYLTTAQSPGAYLTTAALSADSSKYAFTGFTTTTIAGDVIAGTHNTDGLKLAVPAYLTAAAPSPVNFSAGTTSNGLGSVVFSNSNGVSFGLNGSTITATVATNYQSQGAYLTTAMLSNATTISNVNLSAGTTSGNLSAFVFSNSNGVSFGLDGSTVTGSISTTMLSEFQPAFGPAPVAIALGQNSLYFAPFDLQQSLSAYRVNLFHSFATTLSASNATGTGGMTVSAALYSRGVGASTERIMSLWSGSWYMTYSNSSHTALSITHPLGISNSTAISTRTYQSAATDVTTYLANSIAGARVVPLPISLTLSPQRYWFAIAGSTNTVSTKYQVLASCYMVAPGTVYSVPFTPFGTSTGANNPGLQPGLGTYSATSGAFPDSIALSVSDIRPAALSQAAFINFSAHATATNLI